MTLFSFIFPANLDLLLLVAFACGGMAAMTVGFFHRRLRSGAIAVIWAGLILLLVSGALWVRQEERSQQKLWSDYLCGLTASFADTTQLIGHHRIQPLPTKETEPEAGENGERKPDAARPVKIISFDKTVQARAEFCTAPETYVELIRLHTDWCRDLKMVGYVFTIRKTGEKKVDYVCSCPSDLNRDGIFEGYMETGDPPFTPYMEGDAFGWQEVYGRGFKGEIALDPNADSNDYGRWATAVAPLYGPDGKIEAVFAVDFHVDDWLSNTRRLRSKTMLLFLSLILLYFGTCVVYAVLYGSIDSFRKMNTVLETARREAESARTAKEGFLANMSHEIRTPMNAVLGMIHLVQRTDLSELQSSYVEKAEQSARLLLRIINDILDFSKIEAGMMVVERSVLSLKITLSELYGMVAEAARKKNLELVFDIAADVPDEIVGDSVRINQVLLNLVNNAIKFTVKGKVELAVRRLEMNNMSVLLQFSVTDTGIGMSPEQMEKLFTPFTQADMSTSRRFGGTGLGLAICKSLVDMMQGKIWCESVSGQGTTFHWTARFERPGLNKEYQLLIDEFDESEPNAGRLTSQSEFPIPDDLRGARILLVEDNKIDQTVARDLLTGEGFDVTLADNGHMALRLMEGNDFDLILMDIQMPEMDGLETTRRIRRNPSYAKLPIIAMTAHAMTGEKERNMEAGMNDCIVKPINPERLYQTVVRWIRPVQ